MNIKLILDFLWLLLFSEQKVLAQNANTFILSENNPLINASNMELVFSNGQTLGEKVKLIGI